MKPHLLLVLALAALPVAVVAQTVAIPMPPPPASAPTRIVGPTPGDRIAGITVTARGMVQAPVHDVNFVAFARGIADTNAVLQAMRDAGVEDPRLGPIDGTVYANGSAQLRGTIRNASEKKLTDIQRAAVRFVAEHPGVNVDNIRFTAKVDDCTRAESAARDAAFADARRRAQAIATAADAAVGPILAVSEFSSCASGADFPVDLTTFTTPMTLNETVVFALAPTPKRRPL